MRAGLGVLYLAGCIAFSGCHKQPQAAAPPVLPQAIPAAQAPPRTIEAPPVETQSQSPTDLPGPPSVGAKQVPTPPPPAARTTRARGNSRNTKPAKPAIAESKPAEQLKPPPDAPKPSQTEEVAPEPSELPSPVLASPVLGEVLSPDQRNTYYRELENNLTEARSLVDTAVRKRPASRQDESVARVRSFIEQAQDYRTRDLRTALSLSRRAVTLARELGGVN